MGCDGGSIPKRSELVKTKKRERQDVDRHAATINEWFYCTLSKQPLLPPIASCALGRLYNKDAIIEFLLDRSSHSDGEALCSHIRKPKDVVTLNLTPNPAFDKSTSNGPELKSAETALPLARFICPITMKEMNGHQRFCYLRPCGCVLAASAVNQLSSGNNNLCLNCNQPFAEVIPINPKGEELETLRDKLVHSQSFIKKSKKRKPSKEEGDKSLLSKVDASSTQPRNKVDGEEHNGPVRSTDPAVPKIIAAKQSSAAIQSIYKGASDGSSSKGNWLTMGTFTRYVA